MRVVIAVLLAPILANSMSSTRACVEIAVDKDDPPIMTCKTTTGFTQWLRSLLPDQP